MMAFKRDDCFDISYVAACGYGSHGEQLVIALKFQCFSLRQCKTIYLPCRTLTVNEGLPVKDYFFMLKKLNKKQSKTNNNNKNQQGIYYLSYIKMEHTSFLSK